jgi:hypothetical protein
MSAARNTAGNGGGGGGGGNNLSDLAGLSKKNKNKNKNKNKKMHQTIQGELTVSAVDAAAAAATNKKRKHDAGVPLAAARAQDNAVRKAPLGAAAVVPVRSVHAQRAMAMQGKAAAIAARQTANARERERLEAAASTVALDFDALDSLPWMPKVAARSAGEGGPPLRNVYTTSRDSDTMDFKPRPPKLGIGAKPAPSDASADDTGLRKVLRKEMHKTQRLQRQAGAAAGGPASSDSDSDSDDDDDGVSRTNAARRRR